MFWNKDGLKKPKKAEVRPKADANYIQLTTLDVIKSLIIDKLILGKDGAQAYHDLQVKHAEKEARKNPRNNFEPEKIKAYTLAIVLDGKVVEIMRAEQKLADILYANPEFVVFSPSETKVSIGDAYVNGRFVSEQGRSTEDTTTEPTS